MSHRQSLDSKTIAINIKALGLDEKQFAELKETRNKIATYLEAQQKLSTRLQTLSHNISAASDQYNVEELKKSLDQKDFQLDEKKASVPEVIEQIDQQLQQTDQLISGLNNKLKKLDDAFAQVTVLRDLKEMHIQSFKPLLESLAAELKTSFDQIKLPHEIDVMDIAEMRAYRLQQDLIKNRRRFNKLFENFAIMDEKDDKWGIQFDAIDPDKMAVKPIFLWYRSFITFNGPQTDDPTEKIFAEAFALEKKVEATDMPEIFNAIFNSVPPVVKDMLTPKLQSTTTLLDKLEQHVKAKQQAVTETESARRAVEAAAQKAAASKRALAEAEELKNQSAAFLKQQLEAKTKTTPDVKVTQAIARKDTLVSKEQITENCKRAIDVIEKLLNDNKAKWLPPSTKFFDKREHPQTTAAKALAVIADQKDTPEVKVKKIADIMLGSLKDEILNINKHRFHIEEKKKTDIAHEGVVPKFATPYDKIFAAIYFATQPNSPLSDSYPLYDVFDRLRISLMRLELSWKATLSDGKVPESLEFTDSSEVARLTR
jgi:hypothetical protein